MVEGVDVACEGKAEARLRDPDAEHSEHSENEAVSVQFFAYRSVFLLLLLEKHSMAHTRKACFKSCRKGFDSFDQEQEFQSSKCGKRC